MNRFFFKQIQIKITLSENKEILDKLYELITKHPGNRPVHIIISSKLQDVIIESSFRVNENIKESLNEIASIEAA